MELDLLADIDDAQLAALLGEEDFVPIDAGIQPRDAEDDAPLSFAQQRFWFLQQLEPESTAYNLLKVYRLEGKVNRIAFNQAFQRLVARHQVLDCCFMETDAGLCQRPVAAVAQINWHDLSDTALAERPARLEALRTAEANRPFALDSERPVRLGLIRYAERESYLVLHLHHIVTDAWSNDLLFRDFTAFYAEACGQLTQTDLPSLPVQYADYAAWQREFLSGDTLDQQLTYWGDYIRDVAPVLELCCDKPRPPFQSSAGAVKLFSLTAERSAQVRRFAAHHNVSQFALFMAVWQLLMRLRSGGQNSFLVGVPNANRHRIEVEQLVGCFINTQLFRADFNAVNTGLALVQQVAADAVQAQNYQDLPFDLMIERFDVKRDPSHSPLFQVMFNYEATSVAVDDRNHVLAGLSVSETGQPHTTAKFDLTLNVYESGPVFHCDLEYCTDLFSDATARQLVAQYDALLAQLMAAPARDLRTFTLVDDAQARELARVEQLAADYSLDTSWLQRFAAQVADKPEAVVVRDSAGTLSWQQLDKQSTALAGHLQQAGVGPDEVVALLGQRSRDFIVALVAILKAGAAWLPLAPDQPSARWKQLIAEADVSAVLIDSEQQGALLRHEGVAAPILEYPGLLAQPASSAPLFRPVAEHPGQLAYVLFTSGSTGTPKGVMVSREGMLNNMLAKVKPLGLTDADCIAQSAGQCFDISVWQMLAAPVLGCQVSILSDDQVRDPDQLSQTLATEAITIAELVPALMQALLDQPQLDLSALRWLMPTGEALPPQLARDWFKRFPKIPLMNAYGPAECADDVAFAPLMAAPAAEVSHMPIGMPTANACLYVVDEALNRVPNGVIGELAVGGIGVGRGYRQDPQRTAAVFVPDPFGAPGARLYLTGDLVKRQADGQLAYIGRRDFQVKIRGQRIELGEIESCLEGLPAVRQAVVTAEGGQHLVAYVTGHGLAPELLKQQLAELLPGYMVPSLIMLLDSMPLSNNGKVDRKALPAADFGQMQHQYEAPEGELEQQLAAIWSELLGIEKVGRNDSFFELGGHSLLATRLVSQINRVPEFQLPLRAVFEVPRLKDLAQQLSNAGGAGQPAIIPVPREQAMPLSFAQQRMWMLEQIEGGDNYLMPGALRLSGPLHIAALTASFNDLVARHEVLRTRFVSVDGEPRQQILDRHDFEIPQIDLRGQPDAEQQLSALIDANSRQRFDLGRAPLMRAQLVRCDDSQVLLFSMHHIISDEWSSQLLIAELSQAYAARAEGQAPDWQPLPVQYADYAIWQRQWLQGETLSEQLRYWQQQLVDVPPVMELPTDYPRPAQQSFAGQTIDFELPERLNSRIQQFCHQRGFTRFHLLLAMFQLLMVRYSGQSCVSIGVPIANRTRVETEAMLGCFINTQVMVLDSRCTPRLIDVIEQTRQRAIDAQTYQDLPFEQLVEHLNVPRSLSHSPLFQVMFNLQQAAVSDEGLQLGGVEVEPLGREDITARFDLTLDISESQGQCRGSVEYCTELFSADTINDLIISYLNLLNEAVTAPEQDLRALCLISDEQQQAMQPFESCAADYVLNQSWLQRFSERVNSQPEAIVVRDQQGALSWQQLDQQSDRLAAHLQQAGVVSDDVVAILGQRSARFIVSLVAILKAGGAWLPLAPDQPPARWQQLLDSANVAAVMADEPEHIDTLSTLGAGMPLLNYPRLLAKPAPDFVPVEERADQLAYVLFTSGSTGMPKGVMISRAGMLNNILAKVEPLGITASDCIAQTAGQCFDISVWQMMAAPVLGCEVAVIDSEQVRDPQRLGRTLIDRRVTIAELVPSLMQSLLEQADTDLSTLRWLMPTGEALPPQLARDWFQRYPAVPLMNAYGPAECADDVAFAPLYQAPPETVSHMPIGQPTANAMLYVVDDSLNRVPAGVVGELAVGGIGVGRGYRQDPLRTAAVFVPDPFGESGARLYLTGDLVKRRLDGALEYIGRRDFQVKIRGQRIELGEIESCLEGLPAVRQAVVTAEGGQHLVAYVTGNGLVPELLKQQLAELLPGYMVPSLIMLLDSMPLSNNGKVDRKALPAADFGQMQRQYQPPESELEQKLAAIWSELLGVEKIGRQDNFFELGGHSLLAVKVATRLNSELACEVPVRLLFQSPVLAELAAALVEGTEPESSLLPLAAHDSRPLLFVVHAGAGHVNNLRSMAAALAPHCSVIGIQARALASGRYDAQSLEELITDYGQQVMNYAAEREISLLSWSNGCFLTLGLEDYLRRHGRQVKQLLLLDGWISHTGQSGAPDWIKAMTDWPLLAALPEAVRQQLPPLLEQSFMPALAFISEQLQQAGLPQPEPETLIEHYLDYLTARYQLPAPAADFQLWLASENFEAANEQAWRQWAGGHCQLHRAEADHFSIVESPNVISEIAALFQASSD